MEPKLVVYECEECGNLFYRDVVEVLVDDAEHCEVKVALVPENETGEIEEFPMCKCLGGHDGYTVGRTETASEVAE